MLSIQVNGVEAAKVSNTPQHLKFYTPAKHGNRAWKIVDEETGLTIDSYTPPRKTKPVPCTPYKGSWAESVNRK